MGFLRLSFWARLVCFPPDCTTSGPYDRSTSLRLNSTNARRLATCGRSPRTQVSQNAIAGTPESPSVQVHLELQFGFFGFRLFSSHFRFFPIHYTHDIFRRRIRRTCLSEVEAAFQVRLFSRSVRQAAPLALSFSQRQAFDDLWPRPADTG